MPVTNIIYLCLKCIMIISSYLKYISFKYFQILNLSQLRKANVSMSLNMNLNSYSEYEFEST